MDVIWFIMVLLAQLSVSHGITWHTEPGVVCPDRNGEVQLFWEYELGATDPSPPAIRWYKGNTTAGALIATYLFQQGTFHPNYPYNSTGKIRFNQTASPDHDSATIVMTAIEATDVSQYSVVMQDVGDNTNSAIVFCLQEVPNLEVSLDDDVTIPWSYYWIPNNYTTLRWMKENQEIALYDFSTKTFEPNDNRKLGFNTSQAMVDASLTIYECKAEDAGNYTVDLFGEYTSKPTVLEVIVDEDSGLSQAAKIGIGVGVSLGVIAIVLAIVLPLTVCKP